MVIADSVTDMPATEPTDRSSPPTTMVRVTPRPRMATTEANLSSENRVVGCLKLSSVVAKNRNSSTVMAMKP